MKKNFAFALLALVVLLNSCIVSGPKFSNVDCVMKLKTGMTKTEVETQLGLGPYDLNKFDSLGRNSYIYKYRTMDRKTLPFFVKETNGIKSKGKYMDLVAYYDTANVAYAFESRNTDSKLNEKRINFNHLMTATTILAPSVLIYLGITKE